jgi:DUSAM domain-containing protein
VTTEHPHDWDRVLDLFAQLKRGEDLTISDDLNDLLRRIAPELAISVEDAEAAILTPTGAATLVREMRRRIFVGSRRLGAALLEAFEHEEKGDKDSARKALEAVLSVEVVPLYRRTAQRELDKLD